MKGYQLMIFFIGLVLCGLIATVLVIELNGGEEDYVADGPTVNVDVNLPFAIWFMFIGITTIGLFLLLINNKKHGDKNEKTKNNI